MAEVVDEAEIEACNISSVGCFTYTHSARLVGNTFFSGCLLYDDEQPVAAR